MKIAVLGYSGAGKSTLAKQLAQHYNIPLLYLDCVNFEENWKLRDRKEGRQIVADFMKQDSWVIDGNYSEFYQAERLEKASLILILKYSRFACLKGVFGRYFANKGKARESIANGCTEKIDFEFFNWVLWRQYSFAKTIKWNRLKKKYPNKVYIFKSRKELNEFLLRYFKGFSEMKNV